MKFLADFLPILLFFVVYKFAGIYAATATAMVTSLLQVAWFWWRFRRFEMLQVVTFVLILVLGGATLWLHNEWFIKWKPTVINWVMALIFAGAGLVNKKPLIQTLMRDTIQLPKRQWQHLNLSWVIFFLICGLANLYVIYNFDTNTWVNFKLFGMMGMTIIFVVLQVLYLSRFKTSNG